MSIGKIPDNVINFLAAREIKEQEKAQKAEKKKRKKSALSLRTEPEENDFVLGEIAETPQAAEIAIAEPIAQVDKFSVEYALHQLQEKMQKAQNQCLTSFEIYQRFMLDNNGFTEVLEDRLYNALNKYKQLREEYIYLARQKKQQAFKPI